MRRELSAFTDSTHALCTLHNPRKHRKQFGVSFLFAQKHERRNGIIVDYSFIIHIETPTSFTARGVSLVLIDEDVVMELDIKL